MRDNATEWPSHVCSEYVRQGGVCERVGEEVGRSVIEMLTYLIILIVHINIVEKSLVHV